MWCLQYGVFLLPASSESSHERDGYVEAHDLIRPKAPVARINPTTADAIPPKMYHMVRGVKRPKNAELKLSARDRDATTPMMIRTIPTTKRTTPRILIVLILGLYDGCMD
jgi:hypothetical protein